MLHRLLRRTMVAAALVVFAVSTPVAPEAATPAAGTDDPARTEAALGEITRQLNALDTWLGDADRRRVRLQKEIETRDREVATASASVAAASAALGAAEAELDRLQRETGELRERQAQQARLIASHLSAAHRLAGEDFLKLILNQESPETFDRMIRYHRHFSAARAATLTEYQATLAELEANRARVSAQAEAAAALRTEQEARHQALVAERDARRTLIAELEAEAEDKAVERERLLADRKRLEDLLAELRRRAQAQDGRSFAQRRGNLPWPVAGRVVHGFGQSRAEGRMTWNGILVAAEEGTPFRAVHRGEVVFADWLRGFGLMVIVDHGSGYMTLYGQADALSKRVGERVEAGEVLGQAGRSGGQQQAGLYFEVRHNGAARDPAAWLGKR